MSFDVAGEMTNAQVQQNLQAEGYTDIHIPVVATATSM
jgi:hypothetical protein